MRFIMLSAAVIINLILTGTFFVNLNIADIAPDLLICTMASIALLEKSMMGAVVGGICGLAMDIMFTGAIGSYTIPLFLTGAILYFASNQVRYIDNFLMPFIFAAGAYFVKELITALIVYMLGYSFSFPHMFIRFILPETLVTGIFMLLVHMIFRRIYSSPAMRPKFTDDIKKLL
jgi:rod shape-determining protein MreD